MATEYPDRNLQLVWSGKWCTQCTLPLLVVMAPSPFWDGIMAPSPLTISPNPSVLLRFAKRNLRLVAIITSHDKWGVILRSSGSRIIFTLLMYIYMCVCMYIHIQVICHVQKLISNLKPFDHARSNQIQKDHPSFQLPSGYLTIRRGIDGP